MRSFVLDRAGRLVLPSSYTPELDFSGIESLEELDDVVRRDFETKAPSGTEILRRVEAGSYATRYELLRDLALHLFWANRFAVTMYDLLPTRWGDVPRSREDVFLPVLEPWQDADRKIAAVEGLYPSLPPGPGAESEDRIFEVLFDLYRHKRHHATELPAVKPTVAEAVADPGNRTWRLRAYDPDYPVFSHQQIVDCAEDVPELEALHRWAMVLHNQYPWERSQTELVEVASLRDEDHVVLFHPRDRDVLDFLRRVRTGQQAPRTRPAAAPQARPPVQPYPAVQVRRDVAVMPRLEALAVVKGEQPCTNVDLIRNAAYSWSPMTAQEITDKTGIEQRLYTARPLEDLALEAAQRALAVAGREPEEIGAVLFCTCTSTRLMPSTATWLSGQLGMHQTHASVDLVAACAGFPYGLAEATRLLQEVRRPVLVVCGEKFSDKIGTVRPSRMIFGDGAAAVVVGPAPEGAAPDIEVLQTYASGPVSEVNSIVWPNPAFANSITVYGPEVRSLAGRYLRQMIEELRTLPDPDGAADTLLDSIELVVPHQANKTMVTKLATSAGLPAEALYFDIAEVGNVSAASIPIAVADAVRDGVIDRPVRVFAPGFGAGAVGGYAVLRVDPAVVSRDSTAAALAEDAADAGADRAAGATADPTAAGSSADDAALAFGG
ncbi:3-oxoacyl-[acyl-carrier-protein] synthase III C-terminal domain-containing protein [Quadrisphaera sp. DSM 44207]|uniref:3-oxoacyl-[acyl-carrier-protein] synthase III C-terminal domain-containing protein n=1 Tax=Quadrisphaera sp. DSM 44207 TaxID=1881057 RepID=UPI00088D89A8|nr:3-oxoacyl-[acyl-carrier-protein] synthase III C-terminal domain-containing protein [Quadrisphaera sp. DSM 44207]SDQ88103.1 3-oxoacyl-(acyl-carrier-protein) synthase III [Quadrisphaera sp. DSM 44207]